MKYLKNVIVIILIAAMVFSISSCSNTGSTVQANDLMEGISASKVDERGIDDRFMDPTMEFYVDLFKKTASAENNSLVSPLSVLIALAMTTNGADGETLGQMEDTLGGNEIDLLNEYLYSYMKNLPSKEKSKLTIANSIWFRDDKDRLTVEEMFLQKNADYYGAAAYKSPFDDTTVEDINKWVKNNTDGMIGKIVDNIDADTVMYLINAIVFDAEWEKIYNIHNINQGDFNTASGGVSLVEYMFSEEQLHIGDENAQGFIKPYANGDYSFFALLPEEGMTLSEYMGGLTGATLHKTLSEPEERMVYAHLPKFGYEYKIKMNDALKALGMTDAFNAKTADLSKLGKSSRGNLYIGEVLHKTYINVDEMGTKAGAVTKVEIKDESYVEGVTIRLDRPFIYGIMDNSTKMPVFIGTVADPAA